MRKGGEGSSRQREQPMQRLGGEEEQGALGAPWREIRWWGQVKIEKEEEEFGLTLKGEAETRAQRA